MPDADPLDPEADPLVTLPSPAAHRSELPPPSPLWTTAATARRRADAALLALLDQEDAGSGAQPGR